MKLWIKFVVLITAIPFFFGLSLIGWRVNYFSIHDIEGNIVFAAPTANGNRFTTRYIHSVERTPVEDEYRIVNGRIWMWEGRVRSTNAGLPSVKPDEGRFIETDEWHIYQGGRNYVTEYFYRVGNQKFGLNQFNLEPYGLCDFFRIFTGEKLRISVTTPNLIFAKFIVCAKLADAPKGVPPIMAAETSVPN